MRYFIVFSYFGKSYHGWQRQPNAISVQEVMEDAFSTLLRQKITLTAAGRTDTGVHARKMVAHSDMELVGHWDDLVKRLNSFLPEDIALDSIHSVPEDAHARFDAIERSYEYWISPKKNPFYSDSAYHLKSSLDIPKMNEAAALLLEYKDFECFSKSNTDVKTFLCDIKSAEWVKEEDRIVFRITADRFLRNMVRAIVGTLLEVGQGKIGIEDVKTIIKSKDRSKAGVSVPAKGLYLTEVKYPDGILQIDG
ncbi:MAG: tRNA pseudouridine(38-40) synthase TruA [Bacteroidota bacterium]